MQGASRKALSTLRDQLPTDGDLQRLSDELFAVVSLLTSQGALRRSLADPSLEDERKVRLVDNLLGDKLAAPTVEVVKTAVTQRWSQPRDLLDSLEEVAVDASLGVADAASELDEVEDQLFRFERILEAEPQLRVALTDRTLPADLKRQLLKRLLEGKVTDVTYALLERAVLTPRGRTIERAIKDLAGLAAKRRERLIARVTSAVELTDDEKAGLAQALKANLGHDVLLQTIVDPDLVGGLTVRVGDELFDSSVARQLAEARRKLTSGSVRRT